MRHRYFVLYTGGTIGMRKSEYGLKPDAAVLEKALRPFESEDSFDWHICDPLIDSSAVQPEHWKAWLDILREKINDYDGILILHGTDTMAYTANLLAFALPKLNKPVILTGSQWPFEAVDSDAPANLETAVAALNLPLCQEVAIAFNGALWRAVGSSKVSTETVAGFSTPHYPPLGLWDGKSWSNLREASYWQRNDVFAPVDVLPIDPDLEIAVITFQPATPIKGIIRYLNDSQLPATILQTYGHGNSPTQAELITAMKRYRSRGNVLLNISQVKRGYVAALYAQGHALIQTGVVSGGKWNLETAVAKLIVGLSAGLRGSDLENMLLENYVGEWGN